MEQMSWLEPELKMQRKGTWERFGGRITKIENSAQSQNLWNQERKARKGNESSHSGPNVSALFKGNQFFYNRVETETRRTKNSHDMALPGWGYLPQLNVLVRLISE